MKLQVWQKAEDLLASMRTATRTKQIPFKLQDQILDSTQSISANIAEGYCRRHLNEYIQYLYIALGSAGETVTRVLGLMKTGYLNESEAEEILSLAHRVEGLLLNLVKSLEKKRNSGDWTDKFAESELEYLHDPDHLEAQK